jgi:hypothetical protein
VAVMRTGKVSRAESEGSLRGRMEGRKTRQASVTKQCNAVLREL